ncbi:MAG: hypothetical protein JW726_07625 [Anaerolineales bacterium]|nr:hypothetical protein [Anaerolineales bacterium]
MRRKFSGLLGAYMKEAGLPLRRAADESGIPHQTLFNWLQGSQPRWHAALPRDLQRLGSALGLNDDEITLLQRLAGCIPQRTGLIHQEEVLMQGSYRIPKGWFVTGDAPQEYEIGVDPGVTYEGRPCVTLRAGAEASEFAALAQMIKADAYHGKRLRFSAAVRSLEAENRAALFMRVSGAEGKMLAFDNMRNRPISGTSDWAQYAIVLDVVEQAEEIIFGILLAQQGQVWMADVRLEDVGQEVPTTDILAEVAPYFPVNLGFEE